MFSRLIGVIFLIYATACPAEETASTGRLTFTFGPYVHHFHEDPDHINTPWLVGVEWEPHDSRIDYGTTVFRNSFGQSSVYVYAGKRWFRDDDGQGLFVNVTGGVLYGYRGDYEDKVPFNYNGFAPAIIPGIGYQYHAFNAQLFLLGLSALLFTFSYDYSK